jgi:signal peptidase II
MKKEDIIIMIITCFIVILDQLTKFFISRNLTLHQSLPLIKNIFHLTLIHNTGAVFGILKGHNFIFIILSSVIIILIIYYSYKTNDFNEEILLVLILGGAVGNLIDRLVFGYVIDFIDFRIWPSFNIADSAISLGVILLIIYYLKKK